MTSKKSTSPGAPRATRAATRRVSGSPTLLDRILARTRSARFERHVRDLLIELCKIDTTPNPDVSVMRRAEAACFRVIERELGGLRFEGGRLERRPIDPTISEHEHYSLLHYSKTPRRPAGLTPEQAYAGRSNLVCLLPGSGGGGPGRSVALNAHVDVVHPYFPPRLAGNTLFGRGSCDDKGPLVALVAALQVLDEAMAEAGLRWKQNVLGMFVIEEETGGNGSLALATDPVLRRLYDSVMVLEITGLKLHPANRGAVWYRAELRPPGDVSALEMAADVIAQLELEGAAIRAESRHDLFPQRPVQTCHGIIGPFGEHPSRVCGEVSFNVAFGQVPDARTERLVADVIDAGLAAYIGLYGDKSKVVDPATGEPMVPSHYEIRRSGKALTVAVHGATGHMGAVRERDRAITKMAHMVRALARSRAKIEAVARGSFTLTLAGTRASAPVLVLEGGQGFVPTHGIVEVM